MRQLVGEDLARRMQFAEFNGSLREGGGCHRGRLECGFAAVQTSLDILRPSDQNAADQRLAGHRMSSTGW